MKTFKLRRSFTSGRFSSKKSSSSTKIPAIDGPARRPSFGQPSVSYTLLENSNSQSGNYPKCKKSGNPSKFYKNTPQRTPHTSSSPQRKLSSSSSRRSSYSVTLAQNRLESILVRCRKLDVDHEHLYSVSLLRQASADSSLISTCLLSLLAALSFVLVVLFSKNFILDDVSSCRHNFSQEIHIQTMSWSRLPDGGAEEFPPPGDMPGGDLSPGGRRHAPDQRQAQNY